MTRASALRGVRPGLSNCVGLVKLALALKTIHDLTLKEKLSHGQVDMELPLSYFRASFPI